LRTIQYLPNPQVELSCEFIPRNFQTGDIPMISRWLSCPGGNRPGYFRWFKPWFIFLVTMALINLAFGAQARGDETETVITVNTGHRMHSLNPLIFGQNILFASNSLWNTGINGLDPAAKPLVENLAPTIVRFPGGTASNLYLWEDGLGFRSTEEIRQFSPTITLDGTPNWKTVQQARILGSGTGPLGNSFNFLWLEGNRLLGILNLKGSYPAGVLVRPDARAGQPDYFYNNYGIMEHMNFVTSLDAEAIIVVNYNTGLDQEGRLSGKVSLNQKIKRAAAWVAFVNGTPQDERTLGVDDEGNDWHTVGYWAGRRAAMGHPAPYGVKYWEVGNEMYDKNNEGGFTKAQTYAQDFVAFSRAMKTVDSSIKVGAVGITSPHGHGDADCTDAWNPTVIKIGGTDMDFLILHPYYPAAGSKPTPYQSQAWYTAVMAGASQAVADIKEIRKIIQENAPPGKQIEISVTEYGIWPNDAKDPREWANLGRALFDADLVMSLLRDGHELGINLAANWILHGSISSASIAYDWNSGTRTLRPHYYAMQLLRKMAPMVVETQVTSPTFSVQRVGNVMDASGIPLVGALATVSKDGSLTLLVINRALGASITATIRLMEYTPKSVAQVLGLTASRISDNNEDQSHTVALTTAQINDAASRFTYTFKPHSLTMFKFRAETEKSISTE
jgi:alpha-L-arabinofuranosidase